MRRKHRNHYADPEAYDDWQDQPLQSQQRKHAHLAIRRRRALRRELRVY